MIKSCVSTIYGSSGTAEGHISWKRSVMTSGANSSILMRAILHSFLSVTILGLAEGSVDSKMVYALQHPW